MIQRFHPKNEDKSLYLSLFERQAKRIDVDSKDWIPGLLMMLPSDLVQSITRESEENFDYYTYNKNKILKRLKLSSDEFRKKFVQHQESPGKTLRDYVFEITNFFFKAD
ncbi:retrovirus-related Pol polyprotein from transposon 297 [Nephila pilipes]|uniref:Retrovirus-related Pol polyprotein from transposon 297 n=1 Tax=Nephila pilipes TaxID=299642 RepID=A0A8X6QQP7_NEPPI|nr:retrovirus-related Pol polyprotein from transposon 297 [Nephila pilipes]